MNKKAKNNLIEEIHKEIELIEKAEKFHQNKIIELKVKKESLEMKIDNIFDSMGEE